VLGGTVVTKKGYNGLELVGVREKNGKEKERKGKKG